MITYIIITTIVLIIVIRYMNKDIKKTSRWESPYESPFKKFFYYIGFIFCGLFIGYLISFIIGTLIPVKPLLVKYTEEKIHPIKNECYLQSLIVTSNNKFSPNYIVHTKNGDNIKIKEIHTESFFYTQSEPKIITFNQLLLNPDNIFDTPIINFFSWKMWSRGFEYYDITEVYLPANSICN